MRCDMHPRDRARRRCDHCGARMCKACRSYDHGRALCPLCAAAVDRGFDVAGRGRDPFDRVDRAAEKLLRIPRAIDRTLTELPLALDGQVRPWDGGSHEPSALLAAFLSAIVPGLGQVYNGRLFKGVLVFCTAFLFFPWVYGIVDAAVEASRRARRYRAARYALAAAPRGLNSAPANGIHAPAPAPAPAPAAAADLFPRFGARKASGDELRHELLRAALRKGGEISVTEGVLATGATFEEVQKALDAMLYRGLVDVDNRPGSGVVIYRFHEAADLAGRRPAL